MDLTTFKQNLPSYSKLEDALHDLRLIWSNCKKFNAEGSEIYNAAEQLSNLTEGMIEVFIGDKDYLLILLNIFSFVRRALVQNSQ